MQQIKVNKIKEKGSYIIESSCPIQRNPQPKRLQTGNELDDELEMKYSVLVKIIKIEQPYTVIELFGRKIFLRLTDEYNYFIPSKSFLHSVKERCEDRY